MNGNSVGKYYWIKYCAVMVLLLLTALSYHPVFANLTVDKNVSNPLMSYIYITLFISVALVVRKKDFFNCVFRNLFLMLSILVVTYVIILALFNDNHYMVEIKNISMALLFSLLGFSFHVEKEKLSCIIIFYAILVGYVAVCQIFSNFGGFVISDQFITYGKNTLGVMLASAAISVSMIALDNDNNRRMKVLMWALVLFLFFVTVTIRARASFLTTIIVVLFSLYKYVQESKSNQKKFVEYSFVIILVVIVMSMTSTLFDNIYDYVFSSFTQNREKDITSGRIYRNSVAIDVFYNNLLFGNLESHLTYSWVHNYILRVLSSYGLFGAIPLLIVYFFILINSVKQLYYKKFNYNSVGFIVILVPFIISLEEPTFPYSPGTGSILPFFLLGHSLNREKLYKETN